MSVKSALEQFLFDVWNDGLVPHGSHLDQKDRQAMVDKYGQNLHVAEKIILLMGTQAQLEALLLAGEYGALAKATSPGAFPADLMTSPYIIWTNP